MIIEPGSFTLIPIAPSVGMPSAPTAASPENSNPSLVKLIGVFFTKKRMPSRTISLSAIFLNVWPSVRSQILPVAVTSWVRSSGISTYAAYHLGSPALASMTSLLVTLYLSRALSMQGSASSSTLPFTRMRARPSSAAALRSSPESDEPSF